MKCSNCGHSVEEGSPMCQRCGSGTGAKPAAKKPEPKNEAKNEAKKDEPKT